MADNFLKLSKKRKTVYEFDDKRKITDKHIKYILEAAQWSPSCGNLQPWYFVVVRDKKMIRNLLESTHYIHFPFINPDPPVIIAFVFRSDCKNPKLPQSVTCTDNYEQHYSDLNICIGMSVLSASLAACDLGIGTCILTPKVKQVTSLLNVKGKDIVRLLLGVGYEKKGAHQKKRERNQLKNIVFKEMFGVKTKIWK